MINKKIAVYSYKGNPDFFFGARFKWSGIIIIPLILGIFLYNSNKFLLFIPILLFVILLILKLINPNQILVDSSFFILSKKVYYYSSLSKIEVNESRSIAKLFLANKKCITIYRDNFPTGAQKEDKIKKNKMLTFNKVVGKIINKAKVVNPELNCNIKEV